MNELVVVFKSDVNEALSGMGELKGALGGIGDLAKGALTVGLGFAVAGVGALGAGLAISTKAAMDAQNSEVQLDAVLKSTGAAAQEQMAKYVAAQGKVVTINTLSEKEQKKLTAENEKATKTYNGLSDKLKTASARLQDMQAKWDASKTHTASASLALQNAKQDVSTLQDELAKGLPILDTYVGKQIQLTDALGLTKPAAQMTKEELLKLADSLSTVTIYEDDAYVAAETMMLQYTKISKDVFPQAIQASADLASRMGIDLTSAAQMVGKALGEPEQGIGRLNMAFKLFDKDQLKTVEDMAKAGDVAGAQTMILDALTKKIGGAAEAAGGTDAGKWDIFNNKLQNVEEKIGGGILPILGKLDDVLIGALDSPEVKAGIDFVVKGLTDASGGIEDLVAKIKGGNISGAVQGIIKDLLKVAGAPDAAADKMAWTVVDDFYQIKSGIEVFWKDAQPTLHEFEHWLNTDGKNALAEFFKQAHELESVNTDWQKQMGEMLATAKATFGGIKDDAGIQFPSLTDIVRNSGNSLRAESSIQLDVMRGIWKGGGQLIHGDFVGWGLTMQLTMDDIIKQILSIFHIDWEQLQEAFQLDVQDMVTYLAGRGSAFNTAAQDAMQGIIDGFWSMEAAIATALQSIIQQAIDGILAGLGIGGGSGSPLIPNGASVLGGTNAPASFGSGGGLSGLTVIFNGTNAPTNAAEANQSAGLFISALRQKGYAF